MPVVQILPYLCRLEVPHEAALSITVSIYGYFVLLEVEERIVDPVGPVFVVGDL